MLIGSWFLRLFSGRGAPGADGPALAIGWAQATLRRDGCPVSGHTCRGAGHPGRGHQDPPGADRVLRLPVLRGTATRRSCRAPRQFLRPPLTRLGTADTHGVSSPIGACLDWQRHATRTAQPQTPPGRHHQTVPIPPQLACLLRWHLRAFGCAEDGRLFRGARGGPLSESLYGRTGSVLRLNASVVRPAIPGWPWRPCVPWPRAGTARRSW